MKKATKKLLATLMAGAVLIGTALPALAAEDDEPCAHEGMAPDSSYCSDCDTYYIKKQPTSADGYVSVYDIDNVESYQWYGYSEYDLVTDKTVYAFGTKKGEVSTYEDGVWSPVRTEDRASEDIYVPFMMKMDSGDVVLINAYVVYENGYAHKLSKESFDTSERFHGISSSETYNNFSVAIEAYGNGADVVPCISVDDSIAGSRDYELKVVAYFYDASKAAEKLENATAAAPELQPGEVYYSFYTEVEGQDGFMLTDGKVSGNYFCRVTFKDGTVIDTDAIIYSHRISKFPTTSSPSIEVTSGDDASYQWYRESYEVNELSAGEGVYSYTITPDRIERPLDYHDSYYIYTYENVYLFRGTQAIITDPSADSVIVSKSYASEVTSGVYTYDIYDTGYYSITVYQKYSAEPGITLLCTKDEAERLPEPLSYVKGKGWAPSGFSASTMSDYKALIDFHSVTLGYEYGFVPTVFSAFFGFDSEYHGMLDLDIDYTGELDPSRFLLISSNDIIPALVDRYDGKTRVSFYITNDRHYTLVYAGELGDDVYLNAVMNESTNVVPYEVLYSEELGWQVTDGEFSAGYAQMEIDLGDVKAGEYYPRRKPKPRRDKC